MKLNQLLKLLFVFSFTSSMLACSSTSEEAIDEVVAESSDSGIDATTRRARELEEEARGRASAAKERMRRSALATRVFYFDFDIAEFRQVDRDILNFHARDLASDRSNRIRVEGHADEQGTREYNLALGERRANSIMNYLIVNGAARNQIEIVSYGEERPADRGESEAAYQRNRRVELIAQ
jgi:peptidoglycan-associated lipoprotein